MTFRKSCEDCGGRLVETFYQPDLVLTINCFCLNCGKQQIVRLNEGMRNDQD